MEHSISRGMVILGVLLAVGMSAAAFIFGVQAKQIGATQQTITVKGVAEKAVVKILPVPWQICAEKNLL